MTDLTLPADTRAKLMAVRDELSRVWSDAPIGSDMFVVLRLRTVLDALLALPEAREAEKFVVPVNATPDERYPKSPTAPEAAREFTEWFCANYPGPDTTIVDPRWHAPRVFQAATRRLRGELDVAEQNIAGLRAEVERLRALLSVERLTAQRTATREGWVEGEVRRGAYETDDDVTITDHVVPISGLFPVNTRVHVRRVPEEGENAD